MSAQFPPNPFTQRGAIRDPAHFFGRRMELGQIFDRLRTMQSVEKADQGCHTIAVSGATLMEILYLPG